MKKVVLVLVILLIAGFIPFSLQSSININARYFDVCQQFATGTGNNRWREVLMLKKNTAQIKNTHLGFSIRTPVQYISFHNINANSFDVMNTLNHISYHYLYAVIPGQGNTNTTTVVINSYTNGFKWLVSQFMPLAAPAYLPLNLKAFMENPVLYYGFTINETNVDASYMAVKKHTIAIKNKYAEIASAAKEVNDFIDQNKLKAVSAVSASYYPYKTDSLQILVGMPVNKPLTSTGAITFMQLHSGKLLVGNFSGKYGDRQKIYTAMEKYMYDHSLLKQISPFETYLNNKTPSGDSDVVNMQLSYPVL